MSELLHKEMVPGGKAGVPNAREFQGLSDESIQELAESIAQYGLKYPITVVKRQNGKIAIVDGERRWRAIAWLVANGRWDPKKKIKVEFVEETDDLQIVGLIVNIQREGLSSYEIAAALTKIRVERNWSQTDLAEKVHKSKAWVSRILTAFDAAVPVLKDAWKTGKIPKDTVYDLAKLPAAQQKSEVIKQINLRQQDNRAAQGEARKRAKAVAAGSQPVAPDATKFKVNSGLVSKLVDRFTARPPTKETPYLRGVRDGVELVAGRILEGDLENEYDVWAKTSQD